MFARRVRSALLPLLVGGLCGCAGGPVKGTCEPGPLAVTLEAAEQLNPDSQGRSLSAAVQLLQLQDAGALQDLSSSYINAWEKPEESFKEVFLSTQRLIVLPGKTVSRKVERNPQARFLVVMVNYRQPLGTAWMSVYELRPASELSCRAPPLGLAPVSSTEEPIRFRLHGYQIDQAQESTLWSL